MNILGIIPARGGSKGIPKKNIKPLQGKPLLQYTIEAAKESELISRVILSSDDPEISGVAEKLGLEVPFLRPQELSQDDTPSLEVVKHALNYFADQNEIFDTVCLLQPTSPFRRPGLIDQAIKKFMCGKYDSLLSVREIPTEFNPRWIFEEKEDLLEIAKEDKIITRRQDLPKAYHRDGAIYLTRTEVIMEQNSLYGNKIGFIETTGDPYINIDGPEDWPKAEEILAEFFRKREDSR